MKRIAAFFLTVCLLSAAATPASAIILRQKSPEERPEGEISGKI